MNDACNGSAQTLRFLEGPSIVALHVALRWNRPHQTPNFAQQPIGAVNRSEVYRTISPRSKPSMLPYTQSRSGTKPFRWPQVSHFAQCREGSHADCVLLAVDGGRTASGSRAAGFWLSLRNHSEALPLRWYGRQGSGGSHFSSHPAPRTPAPLPTKPTRLTRG